ncbi:MAG: DsbA family protein [Gemmatimonadaceae bacterium]|nr:DsbA family protein [Gemmatimonadaceae bacterium]
MTESKSDKLASWLLAASSVVVAVSVVWRLFVSPAAGARPSDGGEQAAKFVDAWRDAEHVGIHLYGPPSAPVVLAEFGDLECPACRGFHPTLHALAQRHSSDLKIIYVPFPLPMHRFALPAARGMECADSLGLASKWVDAVYEAQDSLGLLDWKTLAQRVSPSASDRLAECATSGRSFQRIERSTAFALAHEIAATPTIWVNGWQFRGGLALSRLDSLVSDLAADVRAQR